MRVIWGLFLGYILAAPLTEKISLDLRLTEWTHLGTYVWWMFAGLIWVGIFFAGVGLFAAAVALWERR